MKKYQISLLFVAVLGVMSCSKTEQPIQTVVEGTVTFSKTGQLAAGETIYIRGFKNTETEPTRFSDATTNYLVAQTQTDAQGKYRIAFSASPDSTYRVVLKTKDGFHVPNLVRQVKRDVSQTVDYGYCKAAFTRLWYFNDRSMRTDSVSLVITRYLPCENENPYVFDDSKFTNESLLTSNSLSEPNSSGSNAGFFAGTEDNTEAVVKFVRYVNGAVVQTRERRLRPRIGNEFNLDTIHIVW